MTTNEQLLIEALKMLAATETRVPPAALETLLLKRLRRRNTYWRWPAAIATLAAAGTLAIIFRPVPVAPVIASAPLMRIPYAEPVEPTDRLELVRVSIPAAQLISWGFPFSGSDPNIDVDAEVLVGEDGLARAIRLVQ